MSHSIKPHSRYGAYHRVSDTSKRDPDSPDYITERDAFEKIDAWAKMQGRSDRRAVSRQGRVRLEDEPSRP